MTCAPEPGLWGPTSRRSPAPTTAPPQGSTEPLWLTVRISASRGPHNSQLNGPLHPRQPQIQPLSRLHTCILFRTAGQGCPPVRIG